MKFQAEIKDRKKNTKLIAIVGVILVFSNIFHNTGTRLSPYIRTLLAGDSVAERPIMHTFYQEAKEGEDDLLEVWKSEWNRAGFDTKVLTIEDARSHEYFEEMEKVIKPVWEEEYNGLCFYRWLAMATVEGGGWMSDYDTLPTNIPKEDLLSLPNGGEFTSFQYHVPCLVVGSQDEWLRVTKLLVDAIPKAGELYDLQTDMMAFMVLRKKGNQNIHFEYDVLQDYEYRGARQIDCEKMRFGRAIHFSHKATHEAFEKDVFISSSHYVSPIRAERVSDFMNDWREQCQLAISLIEMRKKLEALRSRTKTS